METKQARAQVGNSNENDNANGFALDPSSLPAYVITMTEEEFNKVKSALNIAGFSNVTRFPAIVGKDMKAQLENDRSMITYRGVTEVDFASYREAHSSLPSWGGVGCYLSHLGLWREAERSPNGILVFEADATPSENAAYMAGEDMKALVNALGGHRPDFVYLGGFGAPPSEPVPNVPGVSRILDRKYGLEAYYVSPEGARKLIKDALPIEVQVDTYIGYKILRGAGGSERDKEPEADAFVAYQLNNHVVHQENQEGTSIQTKPVLQDVSFLDAYAWLFFVVGLFLLTVIMYVAVRSGALNRK